MTGNAFARRFVEKTKEEEKKKKTLLKKRRNVPVALCLVLSRCRDKTCAYSCNEIVLLTLL